MLQKKAKGLFVELTPFEIRMARTDRFTYPITVEAVDSFALGPDPAKREKLEAFTENRKAPLLQAKCSAFSNGRFLFRHVLDNPSKAKNENFAESVLSEEYKINAKDSLYRLIYPQTGKNFRPQESLSRELLLAGCAKNGIRESQTTLIEEGIYPRTLEIASLPILAGIRSALTLSADAKSVFVIEFGENSSLSYVLGKPGLAFSHEFDFGFNDLVAIVQKELRLQDEMSARKVVLSGTFDFRDFGSKLLAKLIRQVRASAGQFEVQTGRSIEFLYLPGLSNALGWMSEILSDELGMEQWSPPLMDWMELCGMHLQQGIDLDTESAKWFPLFCLMADFSKESIS